MPTYAGWLWGSQQIDAMMRAVDAWGRIQANPTTIGLVRNKLTALPSQPVRIEANSTANEVSGAAGSSGKRTVTVFGIKDHPTLMDTDIQRDDRFLYNDTQYRVVDVITPPGEVQAICEALS